MTPSTPIILRCHIITLLYNLSRATLLPVNITLIVYMNILSSWLQQDVVAEGKLNYHTLSSRHLLSFDEGFNNTTDC